MEDKILSLLNNNYYTISEIALKLNANVREVSRMLWRMVFNGKINRIIYRRKSLFGCDIIHTESEDNKMKIYLASPFFNEAEIEVYRRAITLLRAEGYQVYVPQEHTIENAWSLSNEDWAQQVFIEDLYALDGCDVVMVLNFGMYSDSGTAWEAGYAFAKGKTVVQVLCGGENATYSLMMINGCHNVVELPQIAHFHKVSANTAKVIQK
jgi:nucleoside 2-deoxyribosyltransferase